MKNNTVEFHTRFDPFVVKTTPVGESKTQQHFKDDCDINVLYKRFVKENGFDPVTSVEVNYSQDLIDISMFNGLDNYYESMELAKESFMSLPSEVRAQYENDPARAMEVFGKMSNAELADFGLKNRKLPVEKGVDPVEAQAKQEKVAQDISQDSK